MLYKKNSLLINKSIYYDIMHAIKRKNQNIPTLKKTSLGMHFWPVTGLNANSEELIYQVKLS